MWGGGKNDYVIFEHSLIHATLGLNIRFSLTSPAWLQTMLTVLVKAMTPMVKKSAQHNMFLTQAFQEQNNSEALKYGRGYWQGTSLSIIPALVNNILLKWTVPVNSVFSLQAELIKQRIWIKLPRSSVLLFWASLNLKIHSVPGRKICCMQLSLGVQHCLYVVLTQEVSQKYLKPSVFRGPFWICSLEKLKNWCFCFTNFSTNLAPEKKLSIPWHRQKKDFFYVWS